MKLIGTFFMSLCALCVAIEGYKVGVGRADCTGPSVEITFMGFAQLSQKGKGIHLRQFSRAFIVENNNARVVFVSIDAGMMGHGLKRTVIEKLQKTFGKMYSLENVIISGTHTHGTPGGFLMDLMYDIPILGFISETFNAYVDGIYNSIVRAHNNMVEGKIYISETEVLDANINRSPSAYLNNPEEERAQYQYDTDKILTQLKFVNNDNKILGAINWYPVHPTSMNNTNRLVTTDNVGYASMLLEKQVNPESLPGKGEFVGAFASTNLGDVSPNLKGPKCEKTGEPCDLLTSSCPKGAGLCFASGPGKDIFESTKIIATRIFEKANILLNAQGREVTGDVKFIHQFKDMPISNATYVNPKTKQTETVNGCLPAMGYSFAAGTTDGPGAFDFEQGTTTDNALWNFVRDFIAQPTVEDIDCQSPKPILLATGRATFPYEWQPKIVPTQLVQIGDVIIAAVPGEFTTMSGRRLKDGIRGAAVENGQEVQVIIAGLSNQYTSYVATPEEYQIQRYEGASTIYGPHTLTIYLDHYKKLLTSMMKNEPLDQGPNPPHLDDNLLSLVPGVIYDGHPIGKDFGTIKIQPNLKYKVTETANAKFVAGNPRNNLMHDQTYLEIQQLTTNDGKWKTIANDANWETKITWERISSIFGFSDIDVFWTIPSDTEPGTYRIKHSGYYRFILGGVYPYEGTSRTFTVSK